MEILAPQQIILGRMDDVGTAFDILKEMITTIGRPQIKDKKEIYQLFEITIKNAFEQQGAGSNHAHLAEEINHKIGLLDNDFQSQGKKVYFLVAKVDSQIAGTIALTEPSKLVRDHIHFDLKNIPEVAAVYVLPQFQGQGVGSLLLKRIIEHLQKTRIKSFILDSGFKKAQKFWIKKLGEPTLILKDYWKKDSHHMIWKKQTSKCA